MTMIDNSLTRGNKSEIVGWGMPDFSGRVHLSTNVGTIQSAPADGYLMVRLQQASQDVSYGCYYISLCNKDGTILLNSILSSRAGYEGSCSGGFVPISKGEYVKVIEWTGISSGLFSFIPCKYEE